MVRQVTWRGKADRSFLTETVLKSLGASRGDVVLGPGVGLDNAFVSAGEGRLLVVTCDPVSLIPSIGAERSAALSVHLVASDFATCGVAPQFAEFSFNFPPSVGRDGARRYVKAVGTECERLGVAIVGGHTGSYPGAGLTVMGACTMFGFARADGVVDPTMARPGDSIMMTKGAAIETTAALAWERSDELEEAVGADVVRRAKGYLPLCTTVKDSLAAAGAGLGARGVTSMHDATEGGVVGGLLEMAEASGLAFRVDREKVHVAREPAAVCGAFGIDPLYTLSEGTLLLTCVPGSEQKVAALLRRSGVGAYRIGVVEEGEGVWLVDGEKARRAAAKPDPYWRAFSGRGPSKTRS